MKTMRNSKQRISLWLTAVILFSSFCINGCGHSGGNEEIRQTEAEISQPETETSPPETQTVTLTYWSGLGDKASQVISSNAQIPIYDVLAEMTGVSIEWINPSVTDQDTQLNLLLASQNLPDMIFYDWQSSYSGGLAKAVTDEIAIPLNDLIDEYAPNFKNLLEENPELKKQISLDDGTIAMFPSARTDPRVRIWFGPQIRQDWLDNLGLDMPQTIDDWYNVLKAFKEQDANGNGDMDDEIPFVAAGASSLSSYLLSFAGAYGLVRDTFCVKNGKVVYSPAEAEYKDFLAEMAKWYEEGLIDSDFAAMDGTSVKSLITTDVAGAYFGSLAGNLGGYNTVLKEVYPEAQIVGAPWVTSTDGNAYQQEAQHAQAFTGAGTIVTTACEDPVMAVKWLDEHYSEKGTLLMTFGIEGVSYEMVNGEPVLTDEILNNPSGLSYDIALAQYSMKPNTAEAMDDTYAIYSQYNLQSDVQREANNLWAEGDLSIIMPPVSMTADESAEYSKIMNEITTYTSESIVKFIMGQIDINEFDAFVQSLKDMDLDRAIEIQQTAYDRYMAR